MSNTNNSIPSFSRKPGQQPPGFPPFYPYMYPPYWPPYPYPIPPSATTSTETLHAAQPPNNWQFPPFPYPYPYDSSLDEDIGPTALEDTGPTPSNCMIEPPNPNLAPPPSTNDLLVIPSSASGPVTPTPQHGRSSAPAQVIAKTEDPDLNEQRQESKEDDMDDDEAELLDHETERDKDWPCIGMLGVSIKSNVIT
ncbi:hypothetical protein DFH28DRAFT_1201327 [Melampsora americana]|nr:hypothetical protein DFH28DRAFT_1201327 [Melampsora americana]